MGPGMPENTVYRPILKLCCLVGYLFLSNMGLYETVVVRIGENNPAIMLFYALYACGFSALFVYFSFFSHGVLKSIAFFPFIVSGISGQYYWTITGFPITIDAIEMALINTDGAAGLLAETSRSMVISVGTAAIGALGVLLPVGGAPLQRLAAKPGVRIIALGLAVVMFLGTSTIVVLRNGYGMAGMPVQVSSLFPLPITQISRGFTREDRYVHQQGRSASVVVVIDESVSFRHFEMVSGLIEDGTFPPISHAERNMPILKTAKPFRSMHNCSAQSIWAIVNGLTIHDGEIILAPSLWERAKAAGYRTVYISAQERPFRYQYLQTPNDISLMDERHFFGDLPSAERDRATLGQVIAALKNGEKVFVFVIKSGSHFPYRTQIPRGEIDRYQFSDGIDLKEREYLVSIYRNTFRFLGDMLTDSATAAPMIFYTSDHGQNLQASGFAHCNSAEPHPAEWEVPLLTHNVPQEITASLIANSRLHGSILRAMGYAALNEEGREPRDLLLFGSLNTRLRGQLSYFEAD